MENFSVVLGLCRSALQDSNPAIRGHVQRLIRELDKDQQHDQVEALKKLLEPAERQAEMAPSRVVLSRASLFGEMLTPSVPAPVDKETGAPLAEIVHPRTGVTQQPIFNPTLSSGINTLLDEWRHVDELRAIGVRPALATMLFGVPGTGKTMLAHHIAEQLDLPLIVARLDGLISSFLGTTARNISNLFSFANRYKCVLLLDEFDAVAKLRDDPHELGEIKRVVNTLLQCIDSRSKLGFTIAITNHESLLDPAIWRRFDIRIEVPKPDVLTRIEMLRRHVDISILDETYIRFLAWITEGESGSDVEKLADFLKRQKAIQKESFDFFTSVKNYVQMSAYEGNSRNRSLINQNQEKLARALAQDQTIPFNQDQLATLFRCTQPTISRWLKIKDTGGTK
jgi:SpoVK/Ycf46/Vps4 family AAA+-type ATPase